MREDNNQKKTLSIKEKRYKKVERYNLIFILILLVTIVLLVAPFIPSWTSFENFDWKFIPIISGIESYYAAIGILASVLSIWGAFYAVRIQIEKDKENFQAEIELTKEINLQTVIDNTFFNLFDMYNNILTEKEELLTNMYNEIEEFKKREQFFEKKWVENNKFEIEDKINTQLDRLNTMTSYGVKVVRIDLKLDSELIDFLFNRNIDDPKYYVGNLLNSRLCDIEKSIHSISNDKSKIMKKEKVNEARKFIKETKSFDFPEEYYEYPKDKHGKIEAIQRMYKEVEYDEAEKGLEAFKEITYEQKLSYYLDKIYKLRESIDADYSIEFDKKLHSFIKEVFNDNFSETGNFFRFFYRVLKYIKDNKGDIELNQYRNYIGFIRGITDEKTMAMIYFNSFYTKNGIKMKQLLIDTNFLGDNGNLEYDAENNLVKHSYFSKGTILSTKDLEKLEDIINKKNLKTI
ncbi:MAG: putative phage abortive infection protein [Vagococcus fluvialis]